MSGKINDLSVLTLTTSCDVRLILRVYVLVVDMILPYLVCGPACVSGVCVCVVNLSVFLLYLPFFPLFFRLSYIWRRTYTQPPRWGAHLL